LGQFRRGRGCPECEDIGYRGRTAIGELLAVDETIAGLILDRSRTVSLHQAAVGAGMDPLENAGIACAAAGVTSLDELRRVLPPGTN